MPHAAYLLLTYIQQQSSLASMVLGLTCHIFHYDPKSTLLLRCGTFLHALCPAAAARAAEKGAGS